MDQYAHLTPSPIWYDIFPFIEVSQPPVEQFFVFSQFLVAFFVSFVLLEIIFGKKLSNFKKVPFIVLISILTGISVVFLINYKLIISDYKELALRFRMRKATNEHLIRTVGKRDFENNYSIKFYGSSRCSNSPLLHNADCSISYTFEPGKQFGGNEYIISYDPQTGQTYDQTLGAHGGYSWPSCEQNLGGCDFKLVLDDIRIIAKEKGFRPVYSYPLVMAAGKVYVKITDFYAKSPTYGGTFLVDPVSGDVNYKP